MKVETRQIGLYLDNTTLKFVDTVASSLGMNRSEFVRYCILHVLEDSGALKNRLKDVFSLKEEMEAGEV